MGRRINSALGAYASEQRQRLDEAPASTTAITTWRGGSSCGRAAAGVARSRRHRAGFARLHDGADFGAHGRGEGAFVAGGVVRGYREVVRGVRLQPADGEFRRARIGKIGNADVAEEIVRRPVRAGLEIDAVALEIAVPVGVPGQRNLLGMALGAEDDQADQNQDRRQPRSESPEHGQLDSPLRAATAAPAVATRLPKPGSANNEPGKPSLSFDDGRDTD